MGCDEDACPLCLLRWHPGCNASLQGLFEPDRLPILKQENVRDSVAKLPWWFRLQLGLQVKGDTQLPALRTRVQIHDQGVLL